MLKARLLYYVCFLNIYLNKSHNFFSQLLNFASSYSISHKPFARILTEKEKCDFIMRNQRVLPLDDRRMAMAKYDRNWL